MIMYRKLTVATALTLASLAVPAALSSPAGSASRSEADIALLQRPAVASDQLPPAVAKLVDTAEVDTTTVRLGAKAGTRQIFVAQGTRGLCLIQVDDPTGPAFVTTCASTLIAGGVYLASFDRAAGSMHVVDVVPDDVTSASVNGKVVPVSGNVLVTGSIPIGSTVELIGANGSQRIPIATGSPQPAAG
jgi:hypothetical protein